MNKWGWCNRIRQLLSWGGLYCIPCTCHRRSSSPRRICRGGSPGLRTAGLVPPCTGPDRRRPCPSRTGSLRGQLRTPRPCKARTGSSHGPWPMLGSRRQWGAEIQGSTSWAVKAGRLRPSPGTSRAYMGPCCCWLTAHYRRICIFGLSLARKSF